MSSLKEVEIKYRVLGQGHPVVFLHGFLESSTMWKHIDLSGCRAVLFDLPGHGGSPIREDESIKTMATKIMDILRQLRINDFSIIGHSMGGYVGLEILNQSRIKPRLMLLNSNFWADSDQKKRDRMRVAQIVKQKKESFLYEAIPNLFTDPTQFNQDVRELLNEALLISQDAIAICSLAMKDRADFSDLVLKYNESISIVQGLDDKIVPVKTMREIVQNTGMEYFEIAAGHMSHIENTKVLQNIITDWTNHR